MVINKYLGDSNVVKIFYKCFNIWFLFYKKIITQVNNQYQHFKTI
jgi:hypothetical protein